MAVTSPLAPLSPPRAMGRGNLCAVVMPWKSNCTHAETEIHETQTHLECIDLNAQAYVASAAPTFSTTVKKYSLLLNLNVPLEITGLTFQAEKQQI